MPDLLQKAQCLKDIYCNLEAYQNLREGDKKLFDDLFPLLLFNEIKQYKNEYLSKRFNMPVSTIEKRLSRLKKAYLITSVESKSQHFKSGKRVWRTDSRELYLDPATFAFVLAELSKNELHFRILSLPEEKRMEYLFKSYEKKMALEKKAAKKEPPPTPKYKLEVHWD